MLKKIGLMVLVMMFIFSLVSCSLKVKLSKQKEIVFYHFDTENQELYNKIANTFNEENKDVVIKVSAIDYNKYMDTLQNKEKKGKLNADIFMMRFGKDYDNLISEKKLLQLKKLDSDIYKIDDNVLRASMQDYKLFAMPMTINTYHIFYNKDIFEKVGLNEPNSIVDLIINSQKLSEKGYAPLGFLQNGTSDKMQVRFFDGIFLNTNGNSNLLLDDKLKLKDVIKKENLEQTLLYLNQLLNSPFINTNEQTQNEKTVINNFINGKFVMAVGESSEFKNIEKYNKNFRFGMFNIPGGLSESKVLAEPDIMLCISRKTKYKKEAKRFLEFLMLKENAEILFNNTEFIPTNELAIVKNKRNEIFNNSKKYGCIAPIFDNFLNEKKYVYENKVKEIFKQQNIDIQKFIEEWQKEIWFCLYPSNAKEYIFMRKFSYKVITFLIMVCSVFIINGNDNITYADWKTYNVTVKVVIDNADEYKDIDHKLDQAFVWINNVQYLYKTDKIPTTTQGKVDFFSLKNNEEKSFRFYIYDYQTKIFNVRPYSNSDYHYSLDYIEYIDNTDGVVFAPGTKYEINVKNTFKLSDNETNGKVVLHYSYHPDIKPIEKTPPNIICTKQVDYLSDGELNKDTTNNGKNDYRMYLDFLTEKEQDTNKADIIFIADISGSMAGDFSGFKDILKETFKGLIENPDNRISLITFSTEAQIVASQSNDIDSLNYIVDGLVANGNTCYYKALCCAYEELEKINANKEPDRESIVVFFSDGIPDLSVDNALCGYGVFSASSYGYDMASKLRGVSRFFSIYKGNDCEGSTTLQNLTQYVKVQNPNERIMVHAKNPAEIRYAMNEFFARLGNGLSNVAITDELSDYIKVDKKPQFKATSLTDGKISTLVLNKDYEIEDKGSDLVFKLLIPTTPNTKYTFSYNARPSDFAFDERYKDVEYSDIGDANTDYKNNKTSSGQKGFLAQNSTKISFDYGKGEKGEKTYPNPVIQVMKPGEIKIPLLFQKCLEGKTIEEDMFSFSLYDANGNLLETKKNRTNGDIEFNSVTADKPGNYSYFVKENIPSNKTPYTYDKSKMDFSISVVRAEDDLRAIVNYPQVKTFMNKYTPQAAFVTFNASKILKKGTLTNNQFKFNLTEPNGNLISSTYNNSAGKIIFPPIEFIKAGKYNYKIFEVVPLPANPNMIYDTSIINVSVDVVDKGGYLYANVNYPSDTTFVNEYKYKAIDAGIEAEVVLTGMQLSTGLFNFEMEDQDTNQKYKACNFSDGKITFNCRFTTVGEHNFIVRQIIPDKPMKNLIYDEEPIHLNVKIIDKGNGVIEPVIKTGGKDRFYNAYKVLGEIW